ncbi:MAG TPA: NDP-sugar synthase [Acidimicrobiia bacterium]|nr:NDP-sugar synthase [Acidimicrobiia bacterium]
MKAVVLVGGEGTRLQPLTFTTPKQMLLVAEVTMIERVLAQLADHGVTEAVLSLGHQPDCFLTAFPEDRAAGVALRYAIDPEPLDTAGAIRFAARTAGVDETFVVVNGDVLTDLDVTALVSFHRRREADATIALTRVDDPSAFGVVPTDDDGRVLAFVEKPPRDAAPTDLINAGTYVVEPTVLDRIPEGRASIERQVFPAMVPSGRLYALASAAYWIDAGTPATYLQAQLDYLDGRRGSPPAPKAEERSDGIWWLGEPVIDGTVDRPALIGDAAFVDAGASVERSVIGAGARVEASARVRDSVLLPGAAVRPDAVVEGSVLGERCIVGQGAHVTALSVVGHGAAVPPDASLAGALVRA